MTMLTTRKEFFRRELEAETGNNPDQGKNNDYNVADLSLDMEVINYRSSAVEFDRDELDYFSLHVLD